MKTTLPKVLVLAGVPLVAGAVFLAVRLVWEQTVWSWNDGLQNVGFSLLHSGLGGILILATGVGALWVVALLIAMIVKRSFGGPWPIALLAAYVIACGAISTPYSFWQRVFLDKYLPARAGELFTYAAATGDLKTVSKMLGRGVDINAQGRHGTALHGAVVAGEREMIAFLIERGANVNALNAYGDSPLGYVGAEATPETREILLKHGAQEIRGSEEQRQRVIDEQVRGETEAMMDELMQDAGP
jgi:hypothetical protein